MTDKTLYLPIPGRLTQDDVSEIDANYYCLGSNIGNRISCGGLLCEDCLLDGEAIREDSNRLKNVTVEIWRTSNGQ